MKRFALLALLALPVFAQDPPPIKLGTVNVRELFNNWDKVKDFTTTLEKQKTDQEAELKKMETVITQKMDQVKALAPDSPLRQQIEVDVVKLQAEYEFCVKRWNEMVKAKLDSGVAKLYNEIRDEIEKYAKEKGLTLVLKTDTSRMEDEEGGVNTKINERAVLYADAEFDITKDLIKRMNDKYADEKKNAPQPGGNPPVPAKDGEKK